MAAPVGNPRRPDSKPPRPGFAFWHGTTSRTSAFSSLSTMPSTPTARGRSSRADGSSTPAGDPQPSGRDLRRVNDRRFRSGPTGADVGADDRGPSRGFEPAVGPRRSHPPDGDPNEIGR